CPAHFLPGRRSTSGFAPSVPARLPSVLLLSLPAPLQSVPVPFSSLPGLLRSPPEVLSFSPALLLSVRLRLPSLSVSWRHRRRVRPRAFYPSGRHPSPAATRAAT